MAAHGRQKGNTLLPLNDITLALHVVPLVVKPCRKFIAHALFSGSFCGASGCARSVADLVDMLPCKLPDVLAAAWPHYFI